MTLMQHREETKLKDELGGEKEWERGEEVKERRQEDEWRDEVRRR